MKNPEALVQLKPIKKKDLVSLILGLNKDCKNLSCVCRKYNFKSDGKISDAIDKAIKGQSPFNTDIILKTCLSSTDVKPEFTDAKPEFTDCEIVVHLKAIIELLEGRL